MTNRSSLPAQAVRHTLTVMAANDPKRRVLRINRSLGMRWRRSAPGRLVLSAWAERPFPHKPVENAAFTPKLTSTFAVIRKEVRNGAPIRSDMCRLLLHKTARLKPLPPRSVVPPTKTNDEEFSAPNYCKDIAFAARNAVSTALSNVSGPIGLRKIVALPISSSASVSA
jgi:hypothetical protein